MRTRILEDEDIERLDADEIETALNENIQSRGLMLKVFRLWEHEFELLHGRQSHIYRQNRQRAN